MHMQREYHYRSLLLFLKIEPTGTLAQSHNNTIFADIPDSPTLKYAIIFHNLAEVTGAVSGAGLSGRAQCDIVRRNAALMLFVTLLRDILLARHLIKLSTLWSGDITSNLTQILQCSDCIVQVIRQVCNYSSGRVALYTG